MNTIKIKILEYLLQNKEKEHNILSISKKINTNYSNTYQNIKNMEELKIEKIGKTNKITLNNKLTNNLFIAENNRKTKLLKSEVFQNIQRKVNKTKNPFNILLIFGSSLNTNNPKDIDICIITNSNKKEMLEELETLSYALDINIFTTNQFKEMISKKENNLGNEILKHNVILKGVENYYELIKKRTLIYKH
ncbi:MAG: hypothetical protein ACMXX6_01705 [Candidatus Woesearchaeota archaeon]